MDKSILIEYAEVREEIKDLRKRKEKLEDDIEKLETEMVSDSVACGKKGKKPLKVVRITGIPSPELSRKKTILSSRKALLAEKEIELLDLQNQVEEFIESIEDSELRMIFRFRYVDNLRWFQVAMQMNHMFPKRNPAYTEDNCRMRHNRFLDE